MRQKNQSNKKILWEILCIALTIIGIILSILLMALYAIFMVLLISPIPYGVIYFAIIVYVWLSGSMLLKYLIKFTWYVVDKIRLKYVSFH